MLNFNPDPTANGGLATIPSVFTIKDATGNLPFSPFAPWE